MTKPTKWLSPSEDSDQPRLIRDFAMHSMGSWGPKLSSCGQRRLWSDWADAHADLSLRFAHMPFCWFCHEASLIDMVLCVSWKQRCWSDCRCAGWPAPLLFLYCINRFCHDVAHKEKVFERDILMKHGFVLDGPLSCCTKSIFLQNLNCLLFKIDVYFAAGGV